jgi:hypothetical protein
MNATFVSMNKAHTYFKVNLTKQIGQQYLDNIVPN